MPARAPSQELHARHARPVIAWLSPTSLAACAIGVLAALPHASMSEEATYLISSALGLGLLAGLLMRPVARRKVALVIAMSAVFWVLHSVLPENSILRHASACVAAASLGWCIACVLKAVSPKVALPILRFLLPMTFGALLASAGIAVGMSASLLALAAVALTAAAISRPSAIESPTLQAPSQGAGHAA